MESTSSTDASPPVWWLMQCEQNHSWWRLLPAGHEPTGSDVQCPKDGSEAVTSGRREIADRVSVRLVPAAWEHEGVVGFEDEFFIEIFDCRGSRSLTSGRSFDWSEAIRRMGWLKGLTWEEARRRWARIGLSGQDPMKMASEMLVADRLGEPTTGADGIGRRPDDSGAQ